MPRSRLSRLSPPDRFRVGPLKEGAFSSRLHSERVAAILGIALGVSFSICFLTGLLSHLIQNPPSWFLWPSRPAGLYRVTQGLHVATGLASIPLLLGKLWTVYPRLWVVPPTRDVAHALERISLVPLVGGSIFLLFTGLANIGLWYPWKFFFPAGHFWGAWITLGALAVHVASKVTVARSALSQPATLEPEITSSGLSRRGFLEVLAATSGLITLTTIGQTFRPLNPLALLAPRRPNIGAQGFPVNKSALGAGVTDLARDPTYRLRVGGAVRRSLELSLDDLRGLPQHSAILPISCVEGWSFDARWTGVRVVDLLEMAGAPPDRIVEVESLQPSGRYRASELNALHASDRDTLLALELEGEPLHIDHGYPVRLIGPNRPGVLQTKWVGRLTVV